MKMITMAAVGSTALLLTTPGMAGESKVAEFSKLTVSDTAESDYVVPNSSVATKTDTPLLDTPMAVQVVPGALLEERQIRTALEAVKNLSGVQSSTYEFYDQFLIRGFDSGYGATFRNGLQLRGINEAVNMAFVDHIEVIKGPTSMLYGRVEPGGFVNVVTKRPEDSTYISLQQQGGSWGFLRTTADATGAITADRTLRYRVIVDFDKADSWVRNAHRNNKAVAATLDWSPSESFQGSLQIEHYDYKTSWLDASVPIIGDRPAHVSRHFSILYPQSWDDYPYRTVRTLFAFDWTYAINDTWKITNRFHYVDSNENQQGVYADNFDGVSQFNGVRFTHTGPNWKRTTYNVNLDLTGHFATGSIQHTLLIGVDAARFTDDTPGSTGDIDGAQPLDVFHPVYPDFSATLAALASADATNVIWRDDSKDRGVYIQDQLEFGSRWRVLVGGRYDEAVDGYPDTYGSRDSACYPNCTAKPIVWYPTDHAFSPRAGILYKASETASIYASYSRSFGSANGRDNLGNPLKAQIGKQYELGVKTQTADARLSGSATLFTLTKSNIPEYDPVDFFPHIVGEARSRGLEFDVAGQLTKHISALASYTYDQGIITNDPYSGTEGKHLSGVAPHTGNLWLKYDTMPDARADWIFGAGAYAVGQRQGDDLNTWQIPGYVRFDLMAEYRHPVGRANLLARLNVNNVFDATYFDHGGYGAAAYGAPRTINGAIKVEF